MQSVYGFQTPNESRLKADCKSNHSALGQRHNSPIDSKTRGKIPESWSDFIQSTVTLWTWEAKFATEPIWEGIPGRLDYTSTEHLHVDETERRSFRDSS